MELVSKNNIPYIRLPKKLVEELNHEDEKAILKLIDKEMALYFAKLDKPSQEVIVEEESSISENTPSQGNFPIEGKKATPYELLKKRIYKEFSEKTLIGDIAIDEMEYQILIEYFKETYHNLKYIGNRKVRDPIFATALVQIGIKHYDANYWNHVRTILEVDTLSGVHQGWIGKIFIETSKYYNKAIIAEEERVQNILMHSFVSDKFLDPFFEFLFKFYRIDLFRDLSGNIDDELDNLVEIIARNDNAHRMNLVRKHTSNAFLCYKSYCRERIINILQLMDKVFWDPNAELDYSDRILKHFDRWRKTSEEYIEENRKVQNKEMKPGSGKRRAISPYLKFDMNSKELFIILPPRLLKHFDISELSWRIQTNTRNLIEEALYIEAMTGIKTEETAIRIDFAEMHGTFTIELSDRNNKLFHYILNGEAVRLFDLDGDLINGDSIPVGNVFAFTKNGDEVHSQAQIDSQFMNGLHITYFDFKRGDILFLPEGRVTTIGVKLTEGMLDQGLVKGASSISEGMKIPVFSTPPVFLLKIEQMQLAGTAIRVNGQVYRMEDCAPEEKVINELNAKYAYMLDSGKFKSSANGLNKVEIDIPNRNKLSYEYILIEGFEFSFEDSPYIFKQRGTVTFNDSLNIHCAKGKKIQGENKWNFPLSAELDEISVQVIDKGENINIYLEIPVLKWRLDDGDWYIDRPEEIWHSHFPTFICIKFPEEELVLAFEKNHIQTEFQSERFYKNKGEGYFKCDMTRFKSWIGRDKIKRILSIEHAAGSNPFLDVITQSIVNSKMIRGDFQKSMLIGEFDIIGKAGYYVDVNYQGKTIVEKEPLVNQRFESSADLETGKYHLFLYEAEPGSAFSVNRYTKIDEFETELLNPKNLTAKQIAIKKKQKSLNLNWEYIVDNLSKMTDYTYSGSLFVKIQYGLLWKYEVYVEFIQPDDLRHARISLFDDGEVLDFLYDDKDHSLVDEEESGLSQSARYRRYKLLDNDSNIFEIGLIDSPVEEETGEDDSHQVNTGIQEQIVDNLETESESATTGCFDRREGDLHSNDILPITEQNKPIQGADMDLMEIPLSETGLHPIIYTSLNKSKIYKLRDLKELIQDRGYKGLSNIHGLKADMQDDVKDIIRKYKLFAD